MPNILCPACSALKATDDFPKPKVYKNGNPPKYGICKSCLSGANREKRIKKWFSLSLNDYETILKYQEGVCAICKHPPRKTRLAIDHDHKTGLIRGLLCPFCNRAVGLFKDDMVRFNNTVIFMQQNPATIALGEPRYGLKGRVSNKAATVKRLNREKK